MLPLWGPEWKTLYITNSDGTVYKRKTNFIGAPAWKNWSLLKSLDSKRHLGGAFL